uniref:Uncharacterized protein n=1 Tax=Parasteatoda tepidariorum TaxID=114398 RepID=A0A2L2YRW2_PARTP
MESFYKDPKHPASFGGADAIHRVLKGKENANTVKKWLSFKDSYTLHKPVRRKFQRNRVLIESKK